MLAIVVALILYPFFCVAAIVVGTYDMLKRLLKYKFLVVLFSILLTLYLSNIALTLCDARTWLPPQRGVKDNDHTWGHAIRLNGLGYREREIGIKKPGVLRVMVLGDSLTWGTGMDPCDRWTDRLQSRLGDGYEVYNFACSGDSTQKEAMRMKYLWNRIRPDIVMVGFCYNDPQIYSQIWCPELEKFNDRYGGVLSSAEKSFKTIRLWHVWERIEKAIRMLAYPSAFEAVGRCYDPNSEAWHNWQDALMSIKSCGKPCYFLSLITCGILDAPVRGWHRQVEGHAEQIGFNVVAFDTEMKGLAKKQMMINGYDGHPSVLLQEIYAKKIYEMLVMPGCESHDFMTVGPEG